MTYMQHFKNKCSLAHVSTYFFILMVALLSMSAPTKGLADEDDPDTTRLAQQLESNFWTLVEKQDSKGLNQKISEIFQAQSPSGIIPRKEFIDGLLASTLTAFSMNNLIATRHHNILVITYDFGFNGAGLIGGPTLSVWKKGEQHWKMISHSYFAFPPNG